MEEDPVSDSFFFTQTTFRKTPKRFKKSPEELPTELRFSHLNPRVAAYLANKEKEEREIPSEVFGDGLGNRSLLPQIGQKVTTIRHHLDSALTQDEDSQRFLFQECKTSAVPILVQLARILFYVERRGRVQVNMLQSIGVRYYVQINMYMLIYLMSHICINPLIKLYLQIHVLCAYI